MVAAVFRTVFAQPDAEAVSTRVGRGPRTSSPSRSPRSRAADGRRQGRGTRVHCVPAGALAEDLVHQTERSTRRSSAAPVVGIFPNPAAVVRLVGAVLTCTTNGKPVTAATYRGIQRRVYPDSAILGDIAVPSRPASRHRGSPQPTATAGLCPFEKFATAGGYRDRITGHGRARNDQGWFCPRAGVAGAGRQRTGRGCFEVCPSLLRDRWAVHRRLNPPIWAVGSRGSVGATVRGARHPRRQSKSKIDRPSEKCRT